MIDESFIWCMQPRILIIDDDDEIIEVTKMILEDQGYLVDIGQNEADLFHALNHHRPDLIIMDIWLNGISGNDLTQKLKKDPETQKIPILLFSALIQANSPSKENGPDGFLRKPYDLDNLLDLVEYHLDITHTQKKNYALAT